MSGVFSCWTPLSIPEIWPTSVFIPVAVTTISPRPRVTVEFMRFHVEPVAKRDVRARYGVDRLRGPVCSRL